MENINLTEIIKSINGKFTGGNPDISINKIGIDSRTVEKDSLFFAIKGKNLDGHDFIKDVVGKKVSAIIYSDDNIQINYSPYQPIFVKVQNTSIALEKVAKMYKNKFTDLKTIAITGSNGKTTTKEMLASILKQKAKTLNNQGNFNNRIGVPLTVFNLTYDTKYAVFELGTSEFGEIKTLTDIVTPDYAIITNIGSSHLEFFKNQENVLREKIQIIDGLNDNGVIALNIDNPYLKSIVNTISKKVVTFGFNPNANIYAKNIKLDIDNPTFDVFVNGIFETFEIPLKGKFNILNALGTIAVANDMGFSISEISEGLKTFFPPKMRMQSVKLDNGAIVINDAYNANPSSMKESISSLEQSYPNKDIILVLGDMLELGDNSDQYHIEIGEFINTLPSVNTVYLFGDKSKYMKDRILNKRTKYFDNRDLLLQDLKKDLKENSLVLFKASRGIKLDIIYDKLISREI
ncbi:MAG: UDP-N-acetylmuramoyl-tripeptide--D-alanyl-D-alanine ligase [Endomicrobiaceae bacterium]|nr:UDP-N-acetylmuramoyl-tripeptide--D-alanyl-D-alanine ligase [Endomicrobiaceae bacterium]